MKFTKPPAAVVNYMQREDVPEIDAALMIKRAVKSYNGKKLEVSVDLFVARKLGCTEWQAGRAITWAQWRIPK